jgi:uncharacterized membrane protein (DUF485 family)
MSSNINYMHQVYRNISFVKKVSYVFRLLIFALWALYFSNIFLTSLNIKYLHVQVTGSFFIVFLLPLKLKKRITCCFVVRQTPVILAPPSCFLC